MNQCTGLLGNEGRQFWSCPLTHVNQTPARSGSVPDTVNNSRVWRCMQPAIRVESHACMTDRYSMGWGTANNISLALEALGMGRGSSSLLENFESGEVGISPGPFSLTRSFSGFQWSPG